MEGEVLAALLVTWLPSSEYLFSNFVAQVHRESPEGAVIIQFMLKDEVSMEWLLRFADTLQGLPGLEGEILRAY
jgi:hypothetical protein